MKVKVRNFYILIILFSFIGYIWIYSNSNLSSMTATTSNRYSGCLIKYTTGIPCPSCGTTRSLISLIHFDIVGSILTNPIGIFAAFALIYIPIVSIIDFISKNIYCYKSYLLLEKTLKYKIVWIPLSILLVINWIWNYYKDL
jgi:hypothetical protein